MFGSGDAGAAGTTAGRRRQPMWENPAMQVSVVRLSPGQDLRAMLEGRLQRQRHPAAVVLTCVGSLTRARIRFAGAHEGTHVDGPLEIVALGGTLSSAGVHLHIAVADASGNVKGGHLLSGCTVRTTAEVAIGLLPRTRFARTLDVRTGYRELHVRRRR
jgi:predicted DNA-binding protein with PD1-like motif